MLDAVAPTPLCASAAAESHADTSAAREPSLEISPEQPAPDPSAYQSLVTSHTHTLSYPTEAEIGHTVFQAHPLNLQYLTELDTNASPTIRQLPDTVPKNIKSNSLTFLCLPDKHHLASIGTCLGDTIAYPVLAEGV